MRRLKIESVQSRKVAVDAHADLFEGKQSVDQKWVAGGYVPLNEFSKITFEFFVRNNLTMAANNVIIISWARCRFANSIDAINNFIDIKRY
jgi:hypothetical protein